MRDRATHKLNGAGPASVLVVDGDPSARGLAAQWLAAEGYVAAEAGSARDAWEHLQTHEVHLVALDVTPADGSGIHLFHEATQTCPDTSWIVILGVEAAPSAVETLVGGASAYLVKPVSREQLILHVRRALERRQRDIDNRRYTRRLEQRVRKQTAAIRRAHEETIYRLLSASMWHDGETGMHIRRTGLLSERLAKAAGWSVSDTENIRLAAPMHDVGKIGIPDTVLRKPGKLFLEEFEIMKQHTVIGAKMLAGSQSPMLQMAQEIALCHHERWDGEGYPAGLARYAIPESARIVAIADVYDALIHDRVYRRGLPEEEALTMIQQGAGTHFDPLLLAIFFSIYPEIRLIALENQESQPKPGDPAESVDGPESTPPPAPTDDVHNERNQEP